MGRNVMVIGLTLLFLGWIVYRLVKGDLKEHKSTLALGCTFLSIWTVLYFVLMR